MGGINPLNFDFFKMLLGLTAQLVGWVEGFITPNNYLLEWQSTHYRPKFAFTNDTRKCWVSNRFISKHGARFRGNVLTGIQ